MDSEVTDLDGNLATGIESLRQRIEQHLRWRLGSWFLRRDRGVPYELLVGHGGPEGAAAVITTAIRNEGASEVSGIENIIVTHDSPTRILNYSCVVQTIYGSMSLGGEIG